VVIQGTAKTPQAIVEENKSDSDKGEENKKWVQQLPNGISIEADGSDDNAYYSIKHPTGARIDINNAGEVTIKGSKVDMFSESTMTLNPKDILTVVVNDQVNLKAAKFFFEGDMVIDGTVNITKKVTMDSTLDVVGNVHSDADVTAKVSLNNHVHGGVKSGSSKSAGPE
jgi:phage baseplate assembly protein gpV